MSEKNKYQVIDDGEGVVPRRLLPQIPEDKMGEFLMGLRKRGVKLAAYRLPANRIRPIQKHANKDKLRKMQPDSDKFENGIFLISADNYLLDGHHRWLILKGTNEERPVRVVRIGLPIKQALKVAHQFTGSHREKI